MALQVWLPLTGNLENKGLNGAAVTNTNAAVNDSGKLGQCYLFSAASSSNSHLYLPTTIDTSIKTWSYCCWLKVISFPVGYVPLYTQRAATNSTARSIFLKSTEILVDNGVRATISKTLPTVTNWNHFAFVCSATQIQVYINGELFDAKTITNTAYSGISNDATIGSSKSGAGNTVNNGNNLNGYLNDVRIYDHCLSKAEVREIAKGLVLHYPLNNIYNTDVTNLITSTNGYMTGFGTATNKGGYYNFVTSYTSTGSSSLITPDSQTVGVLTEGKTYLWSFDCRVNACSAAMYLYARTAGYENDTRSGNTFVKAVSPELVGKGWIHYSATRVANSSDTNARLEFVSPNRQTSGTVYSCDIDVRNIMIVEASTDLPYVYNSFKSNVVEDCSGFGNNSAKMSSITLRQGGARYGYSTYFSNTSYICGPYPNTIKPEVFTISFWICLDVASMQYALDCDEGGGFETGVSSQKARISMYMSSSWRALSGATTLALNTWYHLCFTFDKTTVKIYVNGNLDASQDVSAYTLTYNATAPWTLNANPNNVGSLANLTFANMSTGQLSDVRIYTTTLSADDVKALYNCSASIDKQGRIHTGEVIENAEAVKQQVTKSALLKVRSFSEVLSRYDEMVYVEPDGSMWLRIVRQNNPASYRFASTDSFTTCVVKNSRNSWFNASVCSLVDKWELMVKQTATSGGAETKFRWVQTKNPMTAVYADVARANVTFNTTTGYTTPGGSYGGIYKINSNTYLCANNGTSGNWFGAVGSWKVHQSGIPAYNGVVVTTGYCDLYLRIDNVTIVTSTEMFKFVGTSDMSTVELIER